MLLIVHHLNTSYVTVHLGWTIDPSKHPTFKYIICYCSSCCIHGFTSYLLKFKYIICYCSSTSEYLKTHYWKWFKYIICYCSSNELVKMSLKEIAFKYIICYCSSCLFPGSHLYAPHLNTSYVTVHRILNTGINNAFINLNTSYVTVHPVMRI